MLQNEISQIAERLRGLRQMTDTTPEEMAQVPSPSSTTAPSTWGWT